MPGDEKETRPDLEAHAAEVGPPSWHPPQHTPPPLPLDPTVVAPTDVGRRATSTAEAIIAVPRRIGRYAIRNTLGRGGMGVVYLAYDASLDREIALKVIPAGPDADPTDLARFQAEAETAARLHHPNIVPVYEVGKTEDVAYMAMEFVPGGNLHSHLTKAPPTPTEAARLVEQLARGIEYAHEHGVIHRDLKPSNILLTAPTVERGSRPPEAEPLTPRSIVFQPTPKVADFGLAKRVDRPLHLTRSGVALGTPNYMAPEQARGLSSEIGPATDIHALGAILYELLVGFPPFGGGTPMETMHQVVHKTPVSPVKLRHGIPPALEQICLRCLEKHPRKRFPTAGALADALEAFRTGNSAPEERPILATPRPQTDAVPAVPRRRLRVLIPVIALTLVVAAAGLAIWLIEKTYSGRVADAHAARDAHARGAVEAAIAQCEAGHVDQGLARLRELEPLAPSLPVADVIQAWEATRLRDADLVFPTEGTVLALTRDGTKAAIAAGESVQVWSATGRQSLVNPVPAGDEVTALGWDAAGQVVAVGTKHGKLLTGDLTKTPFKLTPVGDSQGGPITAVEPIEDGVTFAVGSEPLLRDSRMKSGPPTPGPVGPVVAVAIHPWGGGQAAVTTTGGVRLFDKADDRWHDLLPDGHATAIAYSSDGNVLAVGTSAGTVRLWDAVARVPLTQARPTGSAVAVAAVGVRQAAGAEYEVLALPKVGRAVALAWPSAFAAPPIRLANKPGKEVLGVAFGPGRTNLFVTCPTGMSRWDVRTGARLSKVDEYGTGAGPVRAGAVHGADHLLVAGTGGKVMMVKHDGNQEMASTTAAGVTTVAAGSGRVTAAGRTAKGSGFVRHWSADLTDGSGEAEVSSPVLCQTYLPDGSGLVLGCEDGTVHVWDPGAAADARPPIQTRSPVLCVAASSDRVLAGCADGTARVWSLGTESVTELVTVRHRSEVRAVAFHGDNFLTAGADGALRRWHLSGLPLGPARHHADAISALDVREDLAATGGRDRYVRVWRLP